MACVLIAPAGESPAVITTAYEINSSYYSSLAGLFFPVDLAQASGPRSGE